MKPVLDPDSTKYPNRTFRRGRWMTPRQIEAKREADALRHTRRIRMKAGGISLQVGYAPTPEIAQHLLRKIREEAPDGAAQQS